MSRKTRKDLVGSCVCYEIMNGKVILVGIWYWASIWRIALDDTGWYLLVLGKYKLVLLGLGITWYSVSVGFYACIY